MCVPLHLRLTMLCSMVAFVLGHHAPAQELPEIQHGEEVLEVDFTPDSKAIVSFGFKKVNLWDTRTGKNLFEGGITLKAGDGSDMWGPGRSPLGLVQHRFTLVDDDLMGVVAPSGKLAVVQLAPAKGRENLRPVPLLRDLVTGREKPLQTPGSTLTFFAFSPDGKTLAGFSGQHGLFLWDVATGKLRKALQTNRNSGYTIGFRSLLVFSSDGGLLASTAESRDKAGKPLRNDIIKIWEVSTGKLQHSLTAHQGDVRRVAFSSDGKLLASTSGSPNQKEGLRPSELKLWDVAAGKIIAEHSGHAIPGHAEFRGSIAFHPDGKTLAVGRVDGHPSRVQVTPVVAFYDTARGTEKATFTPPRRSTPTFAISPDGKFLASGGGRDGTVQLWDFAKILGPKK